MTGKKKSLIISIFLILIFAGCALFFYIRSVIDTGFDIKETVYVKIDEDEDYVYIISQIKDSARVENIVNFERVAALLEYPDNIKTGFYAITPDMNILDAVRMLKNGMQTPVRITFNNIRTKEDLCRRLTEQLMIKNEQLLQALNDQAVCEKYGFDVNTINSMFIPNTYEFYWNISLDKFLDRMNSEYKMFWTAQRLEKAKQAGLTPVEVSVLASIVEEECYLIEEYPIVAGLYINRLNRNMLLQADPTVKYAVGDFSIRRVLNKHLKVDSPYNTYEYYGLPPGPIRIPSIKAIESVLNYTKHNYYYMCAKEDFSGRHNFENSHVAHERNRIRYQAELNKRKIYN